MIDNLYNARILDFAGNIGILTLGLLGYHTRKKEISDASVVS